MIGIYAVCTFQLYVTVSECNGRDRAQVILVTNM